MKNIAKWATVSLALAAICPTAASAELSSFVFADERPVSNEILSASRGGTAMFASLSRGRLTIMATDQARSDFRFLGSTGQYQMDIWWGTVGSELIAQSVRDARSL